MQFSALLFHLFLLKYVRVRAVSPIGFYSNDIAAVSPIGIYSNDFAAADRTALFQEDDIFNLMMGSMVPPTTSRPTSPTKGGIVPTDMPTFPPAVEETDPPTVLPTVMPTIPPTAEDTVAPTDPPTVTPTSLPVVTTTESPTIAPTLPSTVAVTDPPTAIPTPLSIIAVTNPPTATPTFLPVVAVTDPPTAAPTSLPIVTVTDPPTATPTSFPVIAITDPPTGRPTSLPVVAITDPPTTTPTSPPTIAITNPPTTTPTSLPIVAVTDPPTARPTSLPVVAITDPPTARPTLLRTVSITPKATPTSLPIVAITDPPTFVPSEVVCDFLGVNGTAAYSAKLEEIYAEISGAGAFDDSDGDRRRALDFIRDEQFCAPPSRLVQRYVAALFFYATHGTDWTETAGWLGPAHECAWFKLVCNNDRDIVRIGVDENELAGTLPPEMCALPKLDQIDLDGNNIVGTIPDTIGDCQSLKIFDLDKNRMTGSLPDSLYTIRSLFSIDVDNNLLTGMLKPEFGNLSNLQYLSLFSNEFTGSIPESLANLTKLEIVYLDGNEFTGVITSDICQLTTNLWLNDFTVDCNKVACNCCTNCDVNDDLFSDNERRLRKLVEEMAVTISGSAATTDGTPQQKATYWLQKDVLRGQNEDVTSLCGLRQRYVATVLYYSLDGGNWLHTVNFLSEANECEWQGEVTPPGETTSELIGLVCDEQIAEGTCVTRIILGDNNLSGDFPEEITQLTNVLLIDMDNNAITSSIPPTIGNRLRNLQMFDMDNNQLTGSLPASLFREQTTIIDVDTNLLGGPLVGLSNAPNLMYFSVYDNLMTGSLPSDAFAAMTKLETLYLDSNQFTGSIGQSVCDLLAPAGSLERLIVDCNISRPSRDCGSCPASSRKRNLGGP